VRSTLAELVYGGALDLFQSTKAKPRIGDYVNRAFIVEPLGKGRTMTADQRKPDKKSETHTDMRLEMAQSWKHPIALPAAVPRNSQQGCSRLIASEWFWCDALVFLEAEDFLDSSIRNLTNRTQT